jgi:hypothetical protein
MTRIHQLVKQAIYEAYSIDKGVKIQDLVNMELIKHTKGLDTLIRLIADESSVPKVVAQQLELVGSYIYLMGEDKKPQEELFTRIIKKLIYDPMNTPANPTPSHEERSAKEDSSLRKGGY